MPSLKDIRKRIRTVRNTQKITRAMKLVAAAKLRRAQDAIIAARPYGSSLERVVLELSRKAGPDTHPLFAEPAEGKRSGKAEVVLLTSDRGLAGSFNAQITRRVESYRREELSSYEDVGLRVVGRKGNDYFKRRHPNILSYRAAPTAKTALEMAQELANQTIDDFTEGRVDRVFLVFNEFKSAISQGVVVKQLLPIPSAPEPADDDADSDALALTSDVVGDDFLYEPSREDILTHIVPLYLQNVIYNAALESIASEFGARMTAMENATRNAGEMISKLTLQYNRARQAAITKELLEIISGAESLKG
ncbi:ATP synthase F1 subunit gamma [Haliangium ochraceum]|uniref:ATP synthase gamma chain n=1 Tax=Haliangium ochraceum (strain DSM 14365 / JCM 11303 / SMP-2) TaxID=502025 RepID=D0LL42_HALO1|nr:ATP synthase F1 subunit gamma [Haliangium ochraceum]ACY18538.1 ATP synthase F1, gamma subunit [Haliangium ochraceum DSM 14365]